MAKRPRISDAQRGILERLYEGGMVGTGTVYKEMVEKATADTGLTKAQVEKWIGNQKRKRPQESSNVEDVTLKRVKGVRGPNSYNLFCADFFKTDECKGLTYQEKNKKASEKWKERSDAEKKQFVDSAKVYKELNVKVSELTEEQKRKVIDRHRKKLLEEILVLEDLGCQTAALYLDVNGEVYNLGSKAGTAFLSTNQEISLKFREYFGGNNQQFTIAHVQNLFNEKYSDACGKPCKVPYLKGGFEVYGLPEGIPFKKPYSYGRIQLKQIMLHADNIHFTITSTPASTSTSTSISASASTSTSPSVSTSGPTSASANTDTSPASSSVDVTPTNTADIQHVLTKICGAEAAKRVLDGGRIEEEEVEVIDLCLSASERLTLYASCTHLFTPDAWLSVGVNMKHSDEATSLVLPIYTTADEQFWLFHTLSKPTRIVKSVNTTKIRGHWLDLRHDGCYTVLNNDQVLGKNIIRTAHGPLYFECSVNLDSEEAFSLPEDVRSVILVTLQQQGLCAV